MLALVLMLVAWPAGADDRTAAEQAALAQLGAMQAGGLLAVLDFMHPDEVDRLGAMLRPMLDVAGDDAARAEAVALLGVDSIEQARKLSGPELVRALFGTLDGRLQGVVRFERFDLVGSVAEGEVVHVLVRVHLGGTGMRMHKLDVMSLKLHRGEWRSLLSGDIEGIGKAIKARFPDPDEPAPD
jgi:hypothetical protein